MPFSLFALGTLERYESDHNIVTQFYNACEGDKFILDGIQMVIDPFAIERNVNQGFNRLLQYLKKAAPDTDGKYRINASGYSRGAVTCLRVANRLYKYLQKNRILNQSGKVITLADIEINIFAVDPVAGIFEKHNQEARDVPPIVKAYISTLQMHDHRKDFTPQDLTRIRILDPEISRVIFLPLFGIHSAGTKRYNKKLYHTADITWQLAYRFFMKHHTRLAGMPYIPDAYNEMHPVNVLTDKQLLNFYAIAKSKKMEYEAAREEGPSLSGQGQRSFVSHLDDYLLNPDFFMNDNERALFKMCYPNVFCYFFEKGLARAFASHKHVEDELKNMSLNEPQVFASLNVKDVKKAADGVISFPHQPRHSQDFEEDICQKLVADIMRELFVYRRNKSEWMAFSVGNEYERTIDIEMAIKLINNSHLSQNEKRSRILDYVEREYMSLHQSNSSSNLYYGLENVLLNYGYRYDKTTQNTGISSKAERLTGAILKTVGEGVKNIGRAAAFCIGAVGAIADFIGNVLMFTHILWPIGKPLSLIGRGIKWLTSNLFSPLLEGLGNGMRGAGKSLIHESGFYQIQRRKSLLPKKTVPAMNPVLRPLVSPPDIKPRLEPTSQPFPFPQFSNRLFQCDEKHDNLPSVPTISSGTPVKIM